MIIVPVKEGENIEKALKKFKRKRGIKKSPKNLVVSEILRKFVAENRMFLKFCEKARE